MEKENQAHKLTNTLICNIEQVARLGRRSATQYFESNENISVSFNDFLILETLSDNPDIHQRNLAKLLVRGTANLSRELDKLEKQDLIERTVSIKSNSTVKTLKLSKKGYKIYQEACNNCVIHIKEIENIFTQKEFEAFMKHIAKLKARLIETCGDVLE